MNWIETVYCSQYYELKQNGRNPAKARLNGTLLTAVILLLAVVVLFKLSGKLFPRHIQGNSLLLNLSGKTIGKIAGMAALLLVYGILSVTIGSKSRYQKMITHWEQLPDEVLKATIKKSLILFVVVFVSFLIAVLFM